MQPIYLNFAKIDGYVDMGGATFGGDLNAESLRVGAMLFMHSTDQNKATFQRVDLNNAQITGNLEMDGAAFDGDLNAQSLYVSGSLLMRSNDQNRATFQGMTLKSAKVAGNVAMNGATFEGNLVADGLYVGGALFMGATFKEVNLTGARVTAGVIMDGAKFNGDLNAATLQVEAGLMMRSVDQKETTFKGVMLREAKITGDVAMDGATFEGNLVADGLYVGGVLFMRDKATFKEVNLTGAKVINEVDMAGSTFNGYLNADRLEVGGALFMNDVIATKRVNMILANVRAALDLCGATLAELDLSGASVAGDLRLGGKGLLSTVWRTQEGKPGKLSLRNARIANLMDARDAWPVKDHLQIDGFTFAHLGGFAGDTGPAMRGRGMEYWDDWIRRDPAYTPTPYEQLATAFVAAGDRPAADEIRFLGRVRQRETETGWWPWTFAGFLQYVAGFGIGDYTFRVLYWVIGISLAGAVYLWACVPRASTNGPIWCLGASLSRLLPVIEINKEFSDFFNDPKRRRLTGRQSFVFSAIGMVGWVLGAILVAAVAGLTQKP
jgi:uncharacterized protein YjbI with pentapeptide repeats